MISNSREILGRENLARRSNLKTKLGTWVNGGAVLIFDRGVVNKSGQMVQYMKAIGWTISSTARADSFSLAAMSMKDSGRMTKLMDTEFTLISREHATKATLKTTRNMAGEWKIGRMVQLSKETTLMVSKMETDISPGPIRARTKENSSRVISRAKVSAVTDQVSRRILEN